MAGENFAGNIIVNLASLPDFLRNTILRKRMTEYFELPADQKKEIIDNALEAGPTIPFPNFARLFRTWLKILAALPEEQRAGLFSDYICEVSADPQKLIPFNLDGILEIFLGLDESERNAIAGSVRGIIGGLDSQDRRRIMLVMPDSAKGHLGL